MCSESHSGSLPCRSSISTGLTVISDCRLYMMLYGLWHGVVRDYETKSYQFAPILFYEPHTFENL